MTGGFIGKIVHVDLSNKSLKEQKLGDDVLRLYIGGSGLAAKLLYDLTGPETNPLGPENVLIFMNGPLTGTRIPLSGRHEVTAKSPATNGFGEADAGGTFGTELKKAGYDGLVIRGRADKPTYLWATENGIEFKDAQHIWGKDTYEADEILKKETDPKAVVACTGPAGEKLARIAGVMHDGRDGRPAARGGLGAVMGSKNLKAIAARGNLKTPLADEGKVTALIKQMAPQMVKNTKSLHDFGTTGITIPIEQLGDLPIKNWVQGRFEEGAQKIAGQIIAKTILTGHYYCGACVVGCGREVEVKTGPWAHVKTGGPEYESVASLGSLCLIDDVEAVVKGHELCNRYGVDVISTGSAIAFAIEAFERSLITTKDTDGLRLEWGNPQLMLTLVEKIGKREGFGYMLGEGVKRTAEKIGPQAEEFALHVKGLEPAMHDPRAYNSVGVSYATSNRGACHLQGFTHVFERSIAMPELGYDTVQDRLGVEGKGELSAKGQNLMSVMDSLKLCKFTLFGGVKVSHMVEWLNAVTGWNTSIPELLRTGERIYNLKRMYNVRCGFSRKDDTLPNRILTLKRKQGGAAENLPPLNSMLEEYYNYRGWDENGIPTPEKLKELQLT
ncbi:MAG: aldehyde ferredoxin oxidoreductase family protein [Candidatus Bathyarchaeia archaeon]